MTFWDHLDELRSLLIRGAVVIVVFAVIAFCFRDELFSVILAPKNADFWTYRFFGWVSGNDTAFQVDLINTGLARQFVLHVQMAFAAGVILVSPYLLFEIFRFVSPALYANERRYFLPALGSSYVMFLIGALASYFLVFPLTFRFLGTYQVSADVPNLVTLDSYISTLLSLTLALGLVFELPVVCWVLGRLGILTAPVLRYFRRHAIVAILVLAAVITPTGDPFTLSIVSLPIWILYEASIYLLPEGEKKGA